MMHTLNLSIVNGIWDMYSGASRGPLTKVTPHGPRVSYPTDTSPIHATHNPVTCMREKHISGMEAFGYDYVEETMGYEHTVEGMSMKRHTTIFDDTNDHTKEIEGSPKYHMYIESQTPVKRPTHDKKIIPSSCIAIHCTMYLHSCTISLPVQPHSHNNTN